MLRRLLSQERMELVADLRPALTLWRRSEGGGVVVAVRAEGGRLTSACVDQTMQHLRHEAERAAPGRVATLYDLTEGIEGLTEHASSILAFGEEQRREGRSSGSVVVCDGVLADWLWWLRGCAPDGGPLLRCQDAAEGWAKATALVRAPARP
jgi:hypothetical protein